MALVSQAGNQLITLFDENVRIKAKEIYQAIPASLIKFLEQRQVIKRIKFEKDLSAAQIPMGSHKKVNFADFENALRNVIRESFTTNHITEVRAETISAAISEEYQKKIPSRADPGKSTSAVLKIDLTPMKKENDFWTIVHAYVYAYIEEECENNWIAEDKRCFKIEMTIELNGITVDTGKAIRFNQMVASKTVKESIEYIEEKYAITWDDI